ncbi:MAG: C40 family peptidase [Thermomicrobiales bacterium]
MKTARKGANRLSHVLIVMLGLVTLAPSVTALAATDLTLGTTAIVTGTGTTGATLRDEPGYDATVLLTVSEGTSVALTEGPLYAADGSAWYGVTLWGETGYLPAYVLSGPETTAASAPEPMADLPTADPAMAEEPVFAAAQTASGETATIAYTNGDGVRCRTEPDYAGAILAVLPEGATISLTAPATGSWQPTTCDGVPGYVHTDFVLYDGAPVAPVAPVETVEATAPVEVEVAATGGDGDVSAAAVIGYGTVVGTDGQGVRCRSAASTSASTIIVLAEGSSVALRGAVQGEWQPVVCAGMNGFAFAGFIGNGGTVPPANLPAPTVAPTATAAPPAVQPGLAAGSNARVTSSLNLRYQPSYSAGVAAVASAGTVVRITGAAQTGFYPVDWDGLTGFMFGEYLVATTESPSERGGSASPAPAPVPTAPPANNGGSSGGSAIANYALQYQGYPYVWAGEGPAAFDCSGFTMWVIRNTVGTNITHDMFVQYDMGAPVAYSDLQPGDLVFFQNTFRWGMSHNGVYIGNGRFIHAENETTGVRISDINSDYYASRYYGAVRFT